MNTIFGTKNQDFRPLIRFGKEIPKYFVNENGDIYSEHTSKILRSREKFAHNRFAEKRLKERAYNVSIPKDLFLDYDYSSTGKNKSRELYISAHRATAEAWMPIDESPPEQLRECWDSLPEAAKQWVRDTAIVDHKDDDPSNNHVSNLQWVVPKDNQTYRKKHNSKKSND
jgi:hypothetical protein